VIPSELGKVKRLIARLFSELTGQKYELAGTKGVKFTGEDPTISCGEAVHLFGGKRMSGDGN
jgi:hypothetical protein